MLFLISFFAVQGSEVFSDNEGGESSRERSHQDEETEVMSTGDPSAPDPGPAPGASAAAVSTKFKKSKKPQNDPVVTLLKNVNAL